MLSNVKQFLIKKTRVTLSLLVFVLLVVLMLKLSSCADVVLDDINEASNNGITCRWSSVWTYQIVQPTVSLDPIRADGAVIPTVWSPIYYDSVMVLTGFWGNYWVQGEQFAARTTRCKMLDTIDFSD